ncbi:MAG: hypothetical protein QGD91_12495 [Actinomycetota bacterium]|nr:hypothetical protein [Actinomycetota bacterium]
MGTNTQTEPQRKDQHDIYRPGTNLLLPIYRRIIKLGHSHAITLPPAWLKRYVAQDCQLVLLITNPNGTITIEPFQRPPHDRSVPPDQPSPDHRRR